MAGSQSAAASHYEQPVGYEQAEAVESRADFFNHRALKGHRVLGVPPREQVIVATSSAPLGRPVFVAFSRGCASLYPWLHSVAPLGRSEHYICLLYTSPSPRDGLLSRMPSS